MLNLYPSIQPYATHQIDVDPIHQLYVEECGNPQGVPILFFHDGPGMGCFEDDRRYFDPATYRIILFDQRGCGRSLPYLELRHNDTANLVNDVEVIRKSLGVDQWLLFGSGWGALLAILYAQKYSAQVMGFILQGTFLGQNSNVDWVYNGKGANEVFPDFWQEFLAPIPSDQRHNPLMRYYEMLTNRDELVQMAAAKAWASWRMHCSCFDNSTYEGDRFTHPHNVMSLALLECFYYAHSCFIKNDQVLDNMDTIRHLPAYLIHGRYDMSTPFTSTWQLNQMWENSELTVIRHAGHAPFEPGMVDAIVLATQKMWHRFYS